ncbi:hypothetical protein MNBD_GAMMA10-2328 [hydrothermal vent metagenome]|uniref:Uncharacterized protein n=1 Tax=hydrothermal vent metagenome TaxID=652676 RepID=A0A3B0Y6Q4_9ZZZZ
MKKITGIRSFVCSLPQAYFILLFVFAPPVFSAKSVFEGHQQEQHVLTGIELERIKTEHRQKFGSAQEPASKGSMRPWGKKKKKLSTQINWGECRDYALYKRKSCYRDGREAYQCEQAYEARFVLCD